MKEVVWQRERELLELEQQRRRRNLASLVEASRRRHDIPVAEWIPACGE